MVLNAAEHDEYAEWFTDTIHRLRTTFEPSFDAGV